MTTNNKQDKWLLVSCLQKSIRKGYVDLALTYADELYEIERAYLLYRLSIIAVEDIGLGNVNAVHDFMETEIKKAAIEERGGKPYVMSVVKEFALSVKDRSACDLTYLSSFYNHPSANESKSLEDIFIDKNENIVTRVLAGWEVLGTKKQKNPFFQKDEDDIEKFLELNSKISDDNKILDIIKYGYKFQREPHFIAMGLLDFLLKEEVKSNNKIGNYNIGDVMKHDFTPRMCGYQNKWLIDGIDWHTAEGKRAIYDFMATKPRILTYLQQYNNDNEILAHTIGNLLFRENGHKVDKRLIYPSAVVILKTCVNKSLRGRLNSNEIVASEAMKIMAADVPRLYEIIEKKQKKPNLSRMPFN